MVSILLELCVSSLRRGHANLRKRSKCFCASVGVKCVYLSPAVSECRSVEQCRGSVGAVSGQCRPVSGILDSGPPWLLSSSVGVSECRSVGVSAGVSECRSVGVSRPYEPHLLDHLPRVRARMSGGPDGTWRSQARWRSRARGWRSRTRPGGLEVTRSRTRPMSFQRQSCRCCFKAQSVLSQWSRSMERHCTLDCHAN